MTIFSKIIAGEIPSYKVYEDDYVFAFLDIKPHTLGHTLIVPKIEVDNFVDVPEPYYSAVFQAAKTIGKALQSATNCVRVGAIIAGLDVPHFHYHLIPLHEITDLNVGKGHELPSEEMKRIQDVIVSELEKLK